VTLATAATLGDRFGRQSLMAFGIGLFTLSSVGCAVAPTVRLVDRRALGAGNRRGVHVRADRRAGRAAFPAERRGAALGILRASHRPRDGGGPVIGRAISQGLDWRFVFGSTFRSVSSRCR
jgi:MFS family permease